MTTSRPSENWCTKLANVKKGIAPGSGFQASAWRKQQRFDGFKDGGKVAVSWATESKRDRHSWACVKLT